MRDSVPSGSYSSVCNVLRQWQSRSSLLIESTDSMIEVFCFSSPNIVFSSDTYMYSMCVYLCRGIIEMCIQCVLHYES